MSEDEKVACPRGHHVSAPYAVCLECGADLTKRCPDGHTIQPGNVHCPTCGKPASAQVVQVPGIEDIPKLADLHLRALSESHRPNSGRDGTPTSGDDDSELVAPDGRSGLFRRRRGRRTARPSAQAAVYEVFTRPARPDSRPECPRPASGDGHAGLAATTDEHERLRREFRLAMSQARQLPRDAVPRVLYLADLLDRFVYVGDGATKDPDALALVASIARVRMRQAREVRNQIAHPTEKGWPSAEAIEEAVDTYVVAVHNALGLDMGSWCVGETDSVGRSWSSTQAGWYCDPLGRFTARWWDAGNWTRFVLDGSSGLLDTLSLGSALDTLPEPTAQPIALPPPDPLKLMASAKPPGVR